MASLKAPDIFQFTDYREYLNAIFAHLKDHQNFSIRKFCEQVGFKSTSYFHMIMDKSRGLSPATSRQVAHRLGLRASEVDFFEGLVRLSRAKNLEERDKFYQKLLQFKGHRKIRKLDQAEYDYFKDWIIVAIHEAIGTEWSRKPAGEMAILLGAKRERVDEALKILERLQLIEKDAGGWKRTERGLQTSEEMGSLHARNFHSEMLIRAKHSLDHNLSDERAFGGLTIALSEKDFKEFKEKLFEFTAAMNAKYSDSKQTHAVFQFNYQLFSLAKFDR